MPQKAVVVGDDLGVADHHDGDVHTWDSSSLFGAAWTYMRSVANIWFNDRKVLAPTRI
ncbi:MAG: hypothetical protein WBP38_02050 [Hyphomicrobium sp.]